MNIDYAQDILIAGGNVKVSTVVSSPFKEAYKK